MAVKVEDEDPLSARYVLTQRFEMGREGWRIKVDIRTRMHSDSEKFYLTGSLAAFENGVLMAEREWDETVARELV